MFKDLIASKLYVSIAAGAIRAALPAISGYVAGNAALQLLDDDQIEKIASALVVVGMVVWSAMQKITEQRVKNRLAQQANTTVEQARADVASPLTPTPSALTPENVVPRT